MNDQRRHPRNLVHLPKECLMDVNIKSTDSQVREVFIKTREERQATKDQRAKKRNDRKNNRRKTVTHRRLRRRIEKRVRADLLTEKQNYLKGEVTGEEYVITTRIRYRRRSWRYKRSFVQGILEKAFADHTGFEHKVDFDTNEKDEWCNGICISYSLLKH